MDIMKKILGKAFVLITKEEYDLLVGEQPVATPAKRGRKPRAPKPEPVAVAAPAPKRRGRKPKAQVVETAAAPAPVKATAGGNVVRQARKAAGLTQAELAKRLGKTQPAISLAEASNGSTDPAFVSEVLKACHLPSDWQPTA